VLRLDEDSCRDEAVEPRALLQTPVSATVALAADPTTGERRRLCQRARVPGVTR
jgi:hypothetical protein